MQVITGKFKGRKLKGVMSDKTRPTLGRIKESMFDLIQDQIVNRSVLDLFAGSGALGIECLSRNAESVVFVDNQPESVKTIKENLRGDYSGAQFICADYVVALRELAKSGKKFDLVLLDPPFASDYISDSLELLDKYRLLLPDAIIMVERSGKDLTSDKNKLPNENFKYIIQKTKNYGTIGVQILKYVK